LIFALHRGRALGKFGMFRQTHTATFFLYSAHVYPRTTKSVDALQTFYVLVFCIIRSWFELLVCMVLFMDGATRLFVGTLYSVCAGTVSHSRNCCQGGG